MIILQFVQFMMDLLKKMIINIHIFLMIKLNLQIIIEILILNYQMDKSLMKELILYLILNKSIINIFQYNKCYKSIYNKINFKIFYYLDKQQNY